METLIGIRGNYDRLGVEYAVNYRDGLKAYWRRVKPSLPKVVTAGSGMTTTYSSAQILARAGVEIESESPDWLDHLTSIEIEAAVNHTVYNYGTVPNWMREAIAKHPDCSRKAIKSVVRKEWKGSYPFHNYISYLAASEPPVGWVASFLRELVVNGPEPHSAEIYRTLAPLAQTWAKGAGKSAIIVDKLEKVAMSFDEKDWHRVPPILAMVLGIAPNCGPSLLRKCLARLEPTRRGQHLDLTLGKLFGSNRQLESVSMNNLPTEVLVEFTRIAQEHPQVWKDDSGQLINYNSPTVVFPLDAENGREAALNEFVRRGGAESYLAICNLSEDPLFSERAHELRLLAKRILTRDASEESWTPEEVGQLERGGVVSARSGQDFHRFVGEALKAIDESLREADFSPVKLLQLAPDEESVQHWLADRLFHQFGEWFRVIREPEVASRKKPDLLILSNSNRWEVAVEIKQSETWSIPQLEYALAQQLRRQYLRPLHRRQGILALTQHRDKIWTDRKLGKRLKFAAVIERLQKLAVELSEPSEGRLLTVIPIRAYRMQSPAADSPKSKKGKKGPLKG